MAEDLENIKKEIQEKNRLIDKLDSCKVQDKGKILKLNIELDKLLYIYFKFLTKGNGLKALL